MKGIRSTQTVVIPFVDDQKLFKSNTIASLSGP